MYTFNVPRARDIMILESQLRKLLNSLILSDFVVSSRTENIKLQKVFNRTL